MTMQAFEFPISMHPALLDPFEFGTNERITYGGIETMQTLHRILFYVHFSAIWYLLTYIASSIMNELFLKFHL